MFFTVKKNIKVAGKYYRPCVCYELPQYLLTTIRGLEEKGKATVTEEPVFFQNGAQIDSEELDRKAKEAEKLEKERKREARKSKKAQKQSEASAITETSTEAEVSTEIESGDL